jgi:hypothetical protein
MVPRAEVPPPPHPPSLPHPPLLPQGGNGTAYLHHNIIVRFNDTTTSNYVSRLSEDYTHVVETHPVEWDCQVGVARDRHVGAA